METNSILNYPIISIIGNNIDVFKQDKDYCQCLKSYIPTLNKTKELIIDLSGSIYERKKVKPLKYINSFRGFSLKFAGFGVCIVEKEVNKIKELSIEELKEYCEKFIKINKNSLINSGLKTEKIFTEVENTQNRESLINLLFFICLPTINLELANKFSLNE